MGGRCARDRIPGRGNGISKYPEERNSTVSPGMMKHGTGPEAVDDPQGQVITFPHIPLARTYSYPNLIAREVGK